ncbi:MAG: histidine phosphatase family protein [Rhodanobacter sp.]
MARILSNAFLMVAALVVACGSAAAHAAAVASPQAASRVIVLVRHGNYDPDPATDPKLGPPLSPIGVAQAHLAGARLASLGLPFDALYVSPVQRARDTAAVIAQDFPGSAFKVDDDLAECVPPTRRKEVTKDIKPADLASCKAQFDRLFDRYFHPAQGTGKAEMLVCHGDVIRYLVTRALGVDTSAWLEMSVRNASISQILVEPDGRFKVISVGDDGFMPANLLTGATGDRPRDLTVPPLPLAK